MVSEPSASKSLVTEPFVSESLVNPPPRAEFPIGKDRSPAMVLFLSIITLGIYFLVWYYKINNEIRQHDPSITVKPGWSVVAMCIPICNLVSGYSTAARIRQMQLDEGATQTISPIVALLLQIFIGIGFPLYLASQLREHWHGHRRATMLPQGRA